MKIKDILNEKEKKQVQIFIKNQTLMDAVKKVLLFTAYYNGTMKKGDNPDPNLNIALALVGENKKDELIGRDVRTLAEAIRVVETGFLDLSNFEEVKQGDKPDVNQAR